MANIATSIFGGYAEEMQAIIDLRMDRFKVPFFNQYLDWGIPQVDLTFADVIGRSRIEAVASVIGEDAVSPVRSRAGIEKLEGKIPTISHKYVMHNSDYRNYITLQNQNNVSDDVKKRQIIDLIFNDVKNAADGCTSRLDVMFLQAISTGKIDLSAAGNPDGIAPGAIDMLLPAANVKNVAKVWSDATATPTTDLEGVIAAAQAKGVTFSEMMMTRATFNKLAANKEIQGVFKTQLSVSLATLANVNEFFVGNGLPQITLVDNLYALEKDGVLTTFKAFADDVIAFIPEGRLGTVKNAIPVEGGLMNVSGHIYADVNRVKIAKWSTTEPMQEFTRGQILAMPAISSIDAIYHLKLEVAAG